MRGSHKTILQKTLLTTTALVALSAPALAQDATWTPFANSNDFNNTINWNTFAVPTGTAFFDTSTVTALILSSPTTIGGVTFNPGASIYSLSTPHSLTFNGAGIDIQGGGLTISNSSAAGLNFTNSSTAGSATIDNNNGGKTYFRDTSSGGTARLIAGAGTVVDFSYLTSSGTTAGSFEGAGQFNLGSKTIIAGGNGRSTVVSGVIADGGENGGTGGALVKAGNGTLTLTGTNTYSGGTTINGGTLRIGDSSNTGKIIGAVTNTRAFDLVNADTSGLTTITNNGGTTTFRNSTSAGSASISNLNSGSIEFRGTSTAGSATIAGTSGSINFYDASTAGQSSFSLPFLNSTSFRNNSSAGSASFNVVNGGVGFYNTATAANAIFTLSGTVTSGSMFFGDTSTAANAVITATGPASVGFQGASTAANATITGVSNLSFGNTASASNAAITNTSGGNASFGDTSTAGSSTIINNSGATAVFHTSSTAGSATLNNSGTINFFTAASGGNARMIANAGSVFNFSGLTSSGTTAGSIEGAGTFYLGSRVLTVGGNDRSTTVSGLISDGDGLPFNPTTGAALTKTGAGMLTLSGTNAYTGATTINAGTLAVNGSTAASSLTTVNAGGTLGGTGRVGNTTIAGGALAPGNSIGTLTVQGNLVFTAASSYMIEVSPTASDRTNVTGTATLGGATVKASFAPGSYVNKRYTIVNATGGVTGTFGALTNTGLPSGFTAALNYDASNAYLDLALFSFPNGLNGNQQGIAGALTRSFNANGGIPGVYGALSANGLTQAAGETATGSQTAAFDAMGQFIGTMTDPNIDGRSSDGVNAGATGYAPDDAMAYARKTQDKTPFARMVTKAPPQIFEARWGVWASGFGGSQTTDGVAAVGSNTTTSSIYGVAAGADYRFSPNTIAGFALAGGGTNFRTANLGSGRSDLFQAGGFIRHNVGAAYITAAAAYGWQDVTTDRTVTIAGVDRLRARFDTNMFTGRIESGYRFVAPAFGGIGLTPYAAGQSTTVFLPSYAEQVVAGANTFALAYASRDVTNTRSELGLRADKSFVMDTAILTLRGRAAWAHNFNPDRSINATFQALPGASFTVNGAAAARDAALTTASAELRWLNGWSVTGTFEGEFSDRSRSYAGKGVVRYAW